MLTGGVYSLSAVLVKENCTINPFLSARCSFQALCSCSRLRSTLPSNLFLLPFSSLDASFDFFFTTAILKFYRINLLVSRKQLDDFVHKSSLSRLIGEGIPASV